jgi:signal transduction histidine kinase
MSSPEGRVGSPTGDPSGLLLWSEAAAVHVEYVRRVSRLWSFLRSHGFDVLIVIAAIGSALGVAFRDDALRAPRTTAWFAVPAAAILVLPLLGRRTWRFGAPVSLWLLAAAFSFVDGRLIVFTEGATVAGMAAAFLLGHIPDARQSRLGLAIVLSGAAIIVYNDPNHSAGDFAFLPALFAIGWLTGFALRERAAQAAAAEERASHAEREREAAARVAVAEERARIARELHDIVAHSVSVIVLHVGAVRHNLPETMGPDKDALRGVEETGRTALADMRRLLGAMRHDGDHLDLAPQPGLGSIDPLLDDFRRAGLPVRLQVDGEPVALPRGLDLSAYRIVQEGLTNALKHAHASHADVVVRYGCDQLQIDVRDDGAGTSPSDGLGHGLVGVRERVKIYGGEMTAGAAAGGGFVLTTSLPLDGHDR